MSFRCGSLKSLQAALAVVVMCGLPPAYGKELPAPAKAEVQTLLNALGNSGCEFYRNGTWYDSAKAKDHIESKLAYLERKELIASAEEFIKLGATKSSRSGEAYQVRCPGQNPEPSATWLERQLKQVRGAAHK